MDLIGPLTLSSSGNRYIIVLTDYLTKWPEAAAIPSKESQVVAKFVISVICRYSSIKTIITDQGREFCNQLNDELYTRLNINHRVATAYHPQTNGQTERYNQTLVNSLTKYINDEQTDWDQHIDPVLLAYRTSVQKSTKETPFYLAFGKKPRLLIEETFPVGSDYDDYDDQEALDKRVQALGSLFKAHSTAQQNITNAQAKQKEYFDKAHQPPTYAVGDMVLVNNAKRAARKGEKLTPRWTGPHKIVSVTEKGTYKLENRKALVNGILLKPYRTAPEGATQGHTETEDCDVVHSEPADQEMCFNQVGPDWQKQRASAVHLQIRAKLKASSTSNIKIYDPPVKKVPITGDGNCLFRTLSYYLTGAQSDHRSLRQLAVEYMQEHSDIFSNLADSPNYPKSSNMSHPGVWGTEVEIYAFATLLATDIYVFGPYARDRSGATIYKWLKYAPLKSPAPVSGLTSCTESIYINNTMAHFEPAVEV